MRYKTIMKLTLPRRLPNSIRGLALFAALVACSSPHLAAASKTPYRSSETALDRYVRTPDASYRHQRVKTHEGPGFKAHVLEMTSQTWLTTNEVDRPEWKHWLTIIQPAEVKSQKALLFIEGGGTDPTLPSLPTKKSRRSRCARNPSPPNSAWCRTNRSCSPGKPKNAARTP